MVTMHKQQSALPGPCRCWLRAGLLFAAEDRGAPEGQHDRCGGAQPLGQAAPPGAGRQARCRAGGRKGVVVVGVIVQAATCCEAGDSRLDQGVFLFFVYLEAG